MTATSPHIDTPKTSYHPNWMTKESLITLENGYLDYNETVESAIWRVANTAEKILKIDGFAESCFTEIWEGRICLSTPIWVNFGNNRGYPISCFGSYVGDSIKSIGEAYSEILVMSQRGGGTSGYFGDIRPRGAKINSTGGFAKGINPPLGIVNDIVKYVEQGDTRKAAFAAYYPIDGAEIEDFLGIRSIGSDIQRIMSGVTISDNFISKLYQNNKESLEIWARVLESREQVGLPYMFFMDNANGHISTPKWYGYNSGNKNHYIKASNLCTEIMLPSNDNWTFVCDLLSLNVANYESWNDKTVQIATFLLDAVATEFIDKTEGVYGMEKARRFTIDNRALGIGVLGWHTFLQEKGLPFAGFAANNYTHIIFSKIKREAELASERLGEMFGNCFVTNYTRRNGALIAIAPTVSNATIMGNASPGQTDISAGIEPIPSNYYSQRSAKGTFVRKNKNLEKLLDSKGYNTEDIWNNIRDNGGSVVELDFLTTTEKQLFATFEEINQFAIVEQAGIRQRYIDQGQSVNLNIPPEIPVKDISKLYLYAHRVGLKSLYYQRSKSVIRGFESVMDSETCVSCSG